MFNPFRWSFRAQFFSGFIACALLIVYALYTQYYLKLDPCPLCIFQRIGIMAMGVLFLMGALQNPATLGRRIYAMMIALAGLLGASVALRHIWIQHLPKNLVPACGPGLDFMLDTFPLSKTLKMVFTGSGECAEVSWNFLGLSMPEWVLICYLLLIVGALWSGFCKRTPALPPSK